MLVFLLWFEGGGRTCSKFLALTCQGTGLQVGCDIQERLHVATRCIRGVWARRGRFVLDMSIQVPVQGFIAHIPCWGYGRIWYRAPIQFFTWLFRTETMVDDGLL